MSFWDLANTYIIYALVLRLEGDLDRAVVVLQLNDQLLGLLITGTDDLRANHQYVANQVAAARSAASAREARYPPEAVLAARSVRPRRGRNSYDSAVLRSGLIIEVPEAETAVAAWRQWLDPQAALGVPAHITVLFPFAAPDRLDDSSMATLSRLVGAAASFAFTLARTAWFGNTTLWLAPEPAAPFKKLTELLSGAFPAYPPYAGQFADVVPHLTIGDHGARRQFLDAERDIQQHLPISADARAVSLMVERSDRRWERLTAFPLATSRLM